MMLCRDKRDIELVCVREKEREVVVGDYGAVRFELIKEHWFGIKAWI